MAASRGADSPRHLRDRIPRPRREIFPERLLDQRHEHRTLRSRQIGAEDFAILDRENARTVQLDGQRDFRFGPAAQKRDDAFCLGIDLEAFVRICLQQLPQLFDRSHDRDERLAEVFLHGGLSLLLKRLFRCATSVEYHIATAEHRLYVGESGGFKSRLERRHFAVHRHDASEKSRIAWHGPKLASCRIPHPSNDYRSEEHTSELQSHHDLVCRLLLEKKKKNEIKSYIKKKTTRKSKQDHNRARRCIIEYTTASDKNQQNRYRLICTQSTPSRH